MPPLLTKRLSCFYCGGRSPYAKDGKTRQFTCQQCEATNYLDKNGDIADVPATPIKEPTESFAFARDKSASPTGNITDDQLFCQACLKNQHLLATVLAEYLPDERHPEYDKFVANYPEYRKELERRYPQVCRQCAPRVQERMRKTKYIVQADMLQKNLERSKQSGTLRYNNRPFLSLFLKLAAWAWWTSVFIQAIWHGFGAFGMMADSEPSEVKLEPLMIIGCVVKGISARRLGPGCGDLFNDLIVKSLLLQASLIWWNPALKEKMTTMKGKRSKMLGLGDYIRMQLVIIGLRGIAWWYIEHHADLGETATRGVHMGMLVFLFLTTLASQRIVTLHQTKLNLKESDVPLVEPDSFEYPTETFTSMPSSRPANSVLRERSSPPLKHFPIANLAPLRSRDQPSPSTATTKPGSPPYSATGTGSHADDMDWEPQPPQGLHSMAGLHSAIQPTPKLGASWASSPAPLAKPLVEPSPFRGHLPPAPLAPAHKIVRPPAPVFKPTPLSQQRDFFKQMGLAFQDSAKKPEASIAIPKHHVATTTSYEDRNKGRNFEFRESKWTLKSDLDAAKQGTGLEDMFTSSIKIADDAVPAVQMGEERKGGGGEAVAGAGPVNTTKSVLLAGALAVLAVLVAGVRDPTLFGRLLQKVGF
ncbi:hypothetical protein H2203_008404 [Taxawa tesnikishii (nom. ined.)]|nr:hypothetical protein H2203_008404 [Dothideales sp. JES 119]